MIIPREPGLCWVCSTFGFATKTEKQYKYNFSNKYNPDHIYVYWLCDDCRLYTASLSGKKERFSAGLADPEGVLMNENEINQLIDSPQEQGE
jgi:hypothetical protein